MDNVPSSAILAIVAIVAACLLGAFIFTTVQSQKESGNQAIAKTEAMNTSLDESTYTQYDGATVTGSQVLSAIKLMKNDGVAVYVDNGKAITAYLNTTDPACLSKSDASPATVAASAEISKVTSGNTEDGDHGSGTSTAGKALSKYSDLIKEAKNKSDTAIYITPSANYVGSVIRSTSNGSIIGVAFVKQ